MPSRVEMRIDELFNELKKMRESVELLVSLSSHVENVEKVLLKEQVVHIEKATHSHSDLIDSRTLTIASNTKIGKETVQRADVLETSFKHFTDRPDFKEVVKVTVEEALKSMEESEKEIKVELIQDKRKFNLLVLNIL